MEITTDDILALEQEAGLALMDEKLRRIVAERRVAELTAEVESLRVKDADVDKET